MKRHLVFFYWLLLLVSTLAIGGVTFYLLQRESDRLRNMAEDTSERTGRNIVTKLDFLVKQAQTTSMDALSKLPESSVEPQLMSLWKDSFPFARSVFYYVPGRGLELPLPQTEERNILEPFLHTRMGGWIWDQPNRLQQWMIANIGTIKSGQPPFSQIIPSGITTDNNGNMVAPGAGVDPNIDANNIDGTPSNSPMSANTGLGISTISIIQLPNGSAVSITKQFQQTMAMNKPEQNWVAVGRGADRRWLGWMQATPDGPVRGMLLSWEALAKTMEATAFPERLDPADGFVLRDPSRKAIIAHFANGALVVGGHGEDPIDDPDAKPAFAPAFHLPIGAEMPGWTLDVYFNPEAKFSSNFMALSTVLVTVLVISVLVGGTLLMREARREASDAARKTSFVSNVSHELKTPLTTIRMYAELLGEGRVRDPAKQRTYLTTIINESQRLTRLVNNVLDFSRLEQGRKKYNSDDVCLAELVRSVLDAQRPRLEEAGFQVEADLASFADLRVHTDRDALEQVLLNLMDNALKYAADGHWLEVKITQKDNHALLAVSDHGPGVPADEQEKIFEMFHRVDDSITARLPGAGLGLSIARRLLRDQEGDLYYEPNQTGGASFVASLPLALAEEKNLPPPAEASLATP